MIAQEEVKACPFCGSAAADVAGYPELVVCSNVRCPAHDPEWDRTDWNARPIEDALRAEVARLRAALESASAKLGGATNWADIGMILNDIDRALGTDTTA